MRPAAPAHGRSCQPLTIIGLEAPRAMSTRRPLSVATDAVPNASDTGPRTAIASGPTFSPMRSVRNPIAVASAKASKECISPTHTVSRPARSAAIAISTASSSGRSSQNGSATPTPELIGCFIVNPGT